MSSVIRLVTQLVQRNCLVACRDVSVSYISCTLRTCEAMVGLSVMRLRYWLNYPGVVVQFPTEWSKFFYLFSNHRDTIILSDVSWTPDLMNIIIVYCAQSLVSVKLKSYVLFFLTRVGYFGQQTICYVTAEPGRFLATVTVAFLQKKMQTIVGWVASSIDHAGPVILCSSFVQDALDRSCCDLLYPILNTCTLLSKFWLLEIPF